MKHRIGMTLVALLSATMAAQADDCKALRLYGSIPLTASSDARRFYVPVEIAGIPKRLLLDTGANLTTISAVAAQELKLTLRKTDVRLYGLSGASTDKFTSAPTKIGNIKAGEVQFMVSPMLDNFDEPDVVGLLGSDILSNFDIALDVAGQKLDILDSDHCPDKVIYWKAAAVAKIPFARLNSKDIVVRVELDGKPLKAILDTGAYHSTIRIKPAERQFALTLGAADTPEDGHLNEREDLKVYRHVFKTLTFEGVTVINPELQLIPDMLSDNLAWTPTGSHLAVRDESLEPDILLGMNILRHTHLYIAYRQRLLYVTPAVPSAATPETAPTPK